MLFPSVTSPRALDPGRAELLLLPRGCAQRVTVPLLSGPRGRAGVHLSHLQREGFGGPGVEQPWVAVDRSDHGSRRRFLCRPTNSPRRGKPTTAPSKRRGRRARRRDERDGPWGCPRGLAGCDPQTPPLWVENFSFALGTELLNSTVSLGLWPPHAVPFPDTPCRHGCPALGCGFGVVKTGLSSPRCCYQPTARKGRLRRALGSRRSLWDGSFWICPALGGGAELPRQSQSSAGHGRA